ncbi:Smr domain protein [Metarhizium robertsii]|uniref:Smr protein/MutS2 n=2 Tax=Metarhizium robertsii TaxID=568076 RepID=E9ENZ1_METRA|nr:Smr protein/MutS2 [Metarhizium robertsii ARSEF 23]EFZ02418.1 Smr protein/MutS2 [Metarhizium robertsii ARSEF 23]EXV05609.1 Smr domain protein [Metarhizium robertsii]
MASENEPDPLQNLVDSFHTLLDEALIVAIASDYDLKSPSAYKQAQATLQDLAKSVPSEEASGFNPSGIPQGPEGEAQLIQDEPTATSTTSASRRTSQAHITDKSSTDNSSCVPDSPSLMPRLTTFNQDSEEDKLLLLQSMFADLKQFDIQYALKKANGDFQTALDDLLNVQYLQSTGQQIKGIDGFFELENGRSKGRKKKKGKKKVASDADQSSDGTSSPSIASETQSQDEIEYVAERFGIRSDQVSPIYYKFQCSKGATVVELLNQYISHGIETQDESGKESAERLAQNYRHVPEKYMPTIVHVAGSIPQFADDIAALLNKYFSKQPKAKKMDLSYRLTPLPQEDIEGGDVIVSPRPGAKPAVGLVAKPSPISDMNYEEAMSRANTFHQARRDAAASAAQMHRRGASSPLFRQAASYYSDRAREQGRYAQSATSTAADILVDQRSTASSIDLHGVLVQDGVRISRQRVQEWWGGLGEMRAKKLREDGGFTVITGLGRHSASGVSQMRQAVAAALLQDGWKLSVETGRFVVTGRR